MPRNETEQGLMPSMLDRLIDPQSQGTAWRYGYGPEQMVAAVRRDLEDLLNTRQSTQNVPRQFREVLRSALAFGLPDVSSLKAVTPQQREDIGRTIESTIMNFEPRLKHVRATMLEEGNENTDRTVRFRIDARLSVDPSPEVAFDTILELASGHYSVKPGVA